MMTSKSMFFSGRPRSRLVNTTWKEISGVDHPANNEEGWMVMKAVQTDGSDTDEWAEELAEELFETDFSKCPPDVQMAARTLRTWLAQEGYSGVSEEHSEEPGEFLNTGLGNTDFSDAPPVVKESAALLGSYLASEHSDDSDEGGDNDEDMSEPTVFPPVGIQLYSGSNKKESNGLYGLRPGNGSQGFTGSLSSNSYGRGKTRRARGMNLTKSYNFGAKKAKPPSFKKLTKEIQKAVEGRFYGPDFGDMPFTTGNNNSYHSSQSPSQFRSADTGGPNFNPQGGHPGAFYDNWTNTGPYIGTGDDGVGDSELASGIGNVAAVSQRAAKEATDAAFYQFLEGSWPGFASKVASIIANYSSAVTSPTWTTEQNVSAPLDIPANVAKARELANEEIHKAVDDLRNQVLTGMTVLTKRNFSDKQRTKLAGTGAALPNGGFPIVNRGDLKNAMRAIGRAKNPDAAKALIRRRAKRLGATNMLTPAFKTVGR